MTGYQEIITDPSYRGQIVLMTQPHIGNYGVDPLVSESRRPWVEGFIAREFTRRPSGSGGEPLIDYLRRHGVPALEGIDTRAVVRRLRASGSLRGVVGPWEDQSSLQARLEKVGPMAGQALVGDVTCDSAFDVPPEGEERCFLALYDFGAKRNIVRSLTRRGARLRVLPASTSAEECMALGVDGVVLSNGPGDPGPLVEVVENIQSLLAAELPILGICLGHQLLGLAVGGRTFKLKYGHHGANQPVLDLASRSVTITSQNHGFAVEAESLPDDCRVTGINLNDGTVQSFEIGGRSVFSVQFHPEASPGPHEAEAIFDAFLGAVTV